MPRILIVDDSQTLRLQLRGCLERGGFKVEEAVDGSEGEHVLAAAKTHYDLFIVNLHMPRLGGLELIRKSRSLPSYGATPIFLLTSEARHGRVQEARDAGATGWIGKPFDPDKLIEGVRMVLNARFGRR